MASNPTLSALRTLRLVSADHQLGEVGTEVAPEIARDPDVAERVDVVLRQACHLARALTAAEQGAIALHATDDDAPRKYFSLSPLYAAWRDYNPDPQGLGLHGLELPPGEVVRLTQEEVETHPAWRGFGDQADAHPPMRGWLATAICGDGGYRYGLLQLSDKRDGADFTEEDALRLQELAELVGAALDALRFAHSA
jgi:GAF domain-containing protein